MKVALSSFPTAPLFIIGMLVATQPIAILGAYGTFKLFLFEPIPPFPLFFVIISGSITGLCILSGAALWLLKHRVARPADS